MSDTLLNALTDEKFAAGWYRAIGRTDETNLVKIIEPNRAVGFVTFRTGNEGSASEVIKIYVHPDHWGQGIGHELIKRAITSLVEAGKDANAILWTMTRNGRGRRFYEAAGWINTHETRISYIGNESFEEIKYQYDAS